MHNYVGQARFHINVTPEGEDSEGSSLFLTHPHLDDIPTTVDTNTIDNFCKQREIRHINFLKIDVEGADPYVIYGAQNLISNGSIDFVQFEYGKGAYQVSHTSFKELYEFLMTRDYILFLIDDRTLLFQQNSIPTVGYGDYLAVHKASMSKLKLSPQSESVVEIVESLVS